jgi:hypothetical protein
MLLASAGLVLEPEFCQATVPTLPILLSDAVTFCRPNWTASLFSAVVELVTNFGVVTVSVRQNMAVLCGFQETDL